MIIANKAFISHSVEDRPFIIEHIVPHLKAVGLEPWMAEDGLVPSAAWNAGIREALEESDWIIVVLSQKSLISRWVEMELDWAVTNRSTKIVPVRIDACDPNSSHFGVSRIQLVDFTKGINQATAKLTRFFVDSMFRPVRRGSALSGSWNGQVSQERGPDGNPWTFEMNLVLRPLTTGLRGQFRLAPLPSLASLLNVDVTDLAFSIGGGFVFERFLQANFTSDDPGKVQFGSMLLELNDGGDGLRGSWIGYGHLSRRIVRGTVDLDKADEDKLVAVHGVHI